MLLLCATMGVNSDIMYGWVLKQERLFDKKEQTKDGRITKFTEKIEKENIQKFREYDEKYSIHYQCREWFEVLLTLLKKSEDKNTYKEVSKCYKNMK